MFYVNFNNSKKILPVYTEEETLNYNEIQMLNRSIDKNNEYINLLNQRIEMINS
jgi:hypothetical protein